MGLHTATIEILENDRLCVEVMKAVGRNYSNRYIQRQFGVSRRQLERIVQTYSNPQNSRNSIGNKNVNGWLKVVKSKT
ncbi:hypothetical protein KQI52_04590 [bacterium]|nr:hypothetical protein [bacterium]